MELIFKNVPKDFDLTFRHVLRNTKCVYTDRSKSRNALFAGYGFTTNDDSLESGYRTASFVSSFCVESMAILQALSFAFQNDWPSITIFSDSKSTLSAIGSPFDLRCGSHLILEIKQLIFSLLNKGCNVSLIWIPGHCGIPGNEKADELGLPFGRASTLNLVFLSVKLKTFGKPILKKCY